MDIPLLSKEDVEKEGKDIEVTIRKDIIEFLKGKGYKYTPSGNILECETNDFFTKDDQFVQVIISDDIPEEILDQITQKEGE